jgi:GT2 family glycosyltransferase
MAAVREFSDDLPSVVLVAQEENIGALENLKFLLAAAETEYFMWLADDDEISPDYLAELVSLLDADSDTVTAVGQWKHMTTPTDGEAILMTAPSTVFTV